MMRGWQWPQGTRCVVFLSINFDAESLDLLSTSEKRLFGRFSYGRYGVRAGFPRLLNLLRRHGIPATTFVPGNDALRHEPLIRTLMDEGHEIAARSVDLQNLASLGDAEFDTLRRSRDILTGICKVPPVGFRAPSNILSLNTLRYLAELGFRYDASFQDDDYPYRFDLGEGRTIVEIPSCFALDDAPAYSGRHSHRRLMQTWSDEFKAMLEAETMCCLTIHLRGDLGSTRAARIAALDEFLASVKAEPGVRFMPGHALATYTESLGIPLEPDPSAAHLSTLAVTPYRGDLATKPM